MHNWHTGDVYTNGVRIHYYRANNGKPPLVLAHGLTEIFEFVAARLPGVDHEIAVHR